LDDVSGDEEELAKLLELVNGACSIIGKSMHFVNIFPFPPLFFNVVVAQEFFFD
jgi:hypothetical protein